ncbi:MAG: hypothetical protein M1833_007317 [Piccolia ochrophora]|nr:MAG: hypothetical protein M1833_007317 [Piccolia ochrophora]
MHRFWAVIISTAFASASFSGNLNYDSPSASHQALGLSLHRIAKRQQPGPGYPPSKLNFTHGVASGDPYPDSVILWTRASPIEDNDDSNSTVDGTAPPFDHGTERYIAASTAPICVDFKIASDEALQEIADSGTAYTSSDIDFTVKVEACNLQPFTTYYYQFSICKSDNNSPVGRTKTSPGKNDHLDSPVKLAVYSCNNLPFGYFNALGNPVRKDSVDYVLFLGDYFYEYENGEYGWGDSLGRVPLPNRETYSLYDYRKRLAQYHADLDLFASHQHFAWIPVWDDHEIADNTWRDGSSGLNNTEESFNDNLGFSVDQRKMNAVRAYFEWMPIRQVDMDDNLRIWRSFSMGSLFDLIMLDTRNYDRSITDLYWNTDYVHEISNEGSRSLMGGRQENWFYNQLSESNNRGATWRLIGNQIVFSRMNQSFDLGNENPLNYDAWDGYQSNRNRTLNHIYKNNISNNIFLSGDSHASWVSDLVWLDEASYDPVTGAGSVGVELAGTAVSSPCALGQNATLEEATKGSEWVVEANEELQWQDYFYRGYYEMSIDYDALNATFYGIPDIRVRSGKEIKLASFQVLSGANALSRNPTVGGGVAAVGALKGGKIVPTNDTVDTGAGKE